VYRFFRLSFYRVHSAAAAAVKTTSTDGYRSAVVLAAAHDMIFAKNASARGSRLSHGREDRGGEEGRERERESEREGGRKKQYFHTYTHTHARARRRARETAFIARADRTDAATNVARDLVRRLA